MGGKILLGFWIGWVKNIIVEENWVVCLFFWIGWNFVCFLLILSDNKGYKILVLLIFLYDNVIILGEFIGNIFGKLMCVFNFLGLLCVIINECFNNVFFFDFVLISLMWKVVLMVRFVVMKVVYILDEFSW